MFWPHTDRIISKHDVWTVDRILGRDQRKLITGVAAGSVNRRQDVAPNIARTRTFMTHNTPFLLTHLWRAVQHEKVDFSAMTFTRFVLTCLL